MSYGKEVRWVRPNGNRSPTKFGKDIRFKYKEIEKRLADMSPGPQLSTFGHQTFYSGGWSKQQLPSKSTPLKIIYRYDEGENWQHSCGLG